MQPIRAIVFDLYGTLYDVHSIVDRCDQLYPGRGSALSLLWRQKQLEYTWLRSLMGRHADFEQVTGSPPPPPTPAASPGPSHSRPNWSNAGEDEAAYLVGLQKYFGHCNNSQRTYLLTKLLDMCTSGQLSYVHQHVSPLLKKDPFTTLPDELCLRVRY